MRRTSHRYVDVVYFAIVSIERMIRGLRNFSQTWYLRSSKSECSNRVAHEIALKME